MQIQLYENGSQSNYTEVTEYNRWVIRRLITLLTCSSSWELKLDVSLRISERELSSALMSIELNKLPPLKVDAFISFGSSLLICDEASVEAATRPLMKYVLRVYFVVSPFTTFCTEKRKKTLIYIMIMWIVHIALAFDGCLEKTIFKDDL